MFNLSLTWSIKYLSAPTTAETSNFSVSAATAGTTTLGGANAFYPCDATSGNIQASLPAAATAGAGFKVAFKKTDSSAYTLTLKANGAETIDGSNTLVFSSQYGWAILICDGTSWNAFWVGTVLNSPTFTGNPKAPTPSVGDDSTSLATTEYVDKNGAGGLSQSWQDVTSSRAGGPTYTNSTGRPIELNIVVLLTNASSSATLSVNGVATAGQGPYLIGGASANVCLSAIVPSGNTYQLSTSGTASLTRWTELR